MESQTDQQDISVLILSNEFHHLREDFSKFVNSFEKYVEKNEEKEKKLDERIKALEDWRIGFVAKFSVYSAVALFFGGFLAQILIYIVTSKLL